MREAASLLIGTHDFMSFCGNKKMKKSTIRTIYSINFTQNGQFLTISFCGNGFLYHMVRILTGTLLEIGHHQKSPEDIPAILESLDRSTSGSRQFLLMDCFLQKSHIKRAHIVHRTMCAFRRVYFTKHNFL